MLAEDGMVGMLQVGVVLQDVVHDVACEAYEGLVLDYVGKFELYHAALLSAFEVSGSAEFEVCLSNSEAICGAAHRLDALLAVLA